MTHEVLDKLFPFIVFYYGFIMTLFLNTPKVQELAEKYVSQRLLSQMQVHRGLSLICLVVGTVWTLQSIWFYY